MLLLIRHLQGLGSQREFAVQRIDSRGSKSAPPVVIADPSALLVPGTNQSLSQELTWYLEYYLEYPFGPHADRAARVLKATHAWGESAFEDLLSQGQARDFYRDATRDGYDALDLVIASDDPAVLAWPWEALRDPQIGDLAQHCRIRRQLDSLPEPAAVSNDLPRSKINILLVTARPYSRDVAYRSISRPLVEMIHKQALPASVKVLRPPTLDQLRRELREHRGEYHIVHFDGHGGFGSTAHLGQHNRFSGLQGHLVFEGEAGTPDLISSQQISALLRSESIPIVVLNACQSAMLGGEADDAFASVATALLRAGVRSVVAMGYALYVSGARQFLPAFYQSLFTTGRVAEATREGRRQMLSEKKRRGEIELEDWIVPVLYEQDPLDLSFASHDVGNAKSAAAREVASIPDEARITADKLPHGVIGRDSAILELERASRRAPAAIVVHGMGGIGKTTLLRGFIEWLSQTGGSPATIVWQDLAKVRSFDSLRNRIVGELLGSEVLARPDQEKWELLLQHLRRERILVVLDNFESFRGALVRLPDAGGQVDVLANRDPQMLRGWLEALRGGAARVLITSRSSEDWIGTEAAYRISLDGLRGEERQDLAKVILADQGILLEAKDQATADLIDSLQGHPLMMRIVLPKTRDLSGSLISERLKSYVPKGDSSDLIERMLHATLSYAVDSLPSELQTLLHPIGMHSGCIAEPVLAEMAEEFPLEYAVEKVRRVLLSLEDTGLLHGRGDGLYDMHPAFERFAEAWRPASEANDPNLDRWAYVFAKKFGALAEYMITQESGMRDRFMENALGTMEKTLALVCKMRDIDLEIAIRKALATYAMDMRYLSDAAMERRSIAGIAESLGEKGAMAAAYREVGYVAEQRREFDDAERWHLRELDVQTQRHDHNGRMIAYGHLARVARQSGRRDDAKKLLRKAQEIAKRQNDSLFLATTKLELGIVAIDDNKLKLAKRLIEEALPVFVQFDDKPAVASSYHELSLLIRMMGPSDPKSFEDSWEYNRKAYILRQELRDRQGIAMSLNIFGSLALSVGNLNECEKWALAALRAWESLGEAYQTGRPCYQLAMVRAARGDKETARGWAARALDSFSRAGDEEGAAEVQAFITEILS